MTKYRIVEAKIPELLNDGITIKYYFRYDIEYQDTLLFGLIKRWNKGSSCHSLEQAKAKIKFLKEEETWTIIDVD